MDIRLASLTYKDVVLSLDRGRNVFDQAIQIAEAMCLIKQLSRGLNALG
jgi:hypothetical protein